MCLLETNGTLRQSNRVAPSVAETCLKSLKVLPISRLVGWYVRARCLLCVSNPRLGSEQGLGCAFHEPCWQSRQGRMVACPDCSRKHCVNPTLNQDWAVSSSRPLRTRPAQVTAAVQASDARLSAEALCPKLSTVLSDPLLPLVTGLFSVPLSLDHTELKLDKAATRLLPEALTSTLQ